LTTSCWTGCWPAALARHQAHEGTAVAGCGLEQGLFAGAVTELDAGHQVANQATFDHAFRALSAAAR
jgi:hypothetical protein